MLNETTHYTHGAKACQPNPENEKAKTLRLFHALEAASDRLAMAGDTEGYSMTLRVLNSITL